MSLLTVIRISSYIYLFTSIVIPIQIIDLTSHYLSLVIIQHIDSSSIIPHVSKCILLSVRFVVLFTILGGNAIYSLVNQVTQKSKKNGSKNVIANDKKPAANVSKPLHSSADLMLKTKNSNDKAEPTTAIPIFNKSDNDINSKNISIEPITKNSAQTSSESSNKVIQTAAKENSATINKEEEPVAVLNNSDTTKDDQLSKAIHETNVKSQELNHNDVAEPLEHNTKQSDSTEPTTPLLSIAKSDDKLIPSENPSVVNSTLVQDHLTKDSNLPTAAPTAITSEHVIPNDTKKEQENNNNIQPEKKAEAIVPSFNKSDEYLDEDEQISTTTTSTTVTPPAERTMSVDSKEEYYNNIIKKDSDIKSFSESVRNIFDGPPTTPLPQQTQKSESILIPLPIDSEYLNETNTKKPVVLSQGSIEETMSTATPALTPHAGSTSSRRSSSASNNTSKSRIQSALHKLSSPRPAPQPPQQQTMEPIEMNTSTSASISKSKSRFSSIRLTRKKSSGSVLSQVEQSKVLQPSPPVDIDVKPTKSSRFNNKLKKTSKRLSKLFT